MKKLATLLVSTALIGGLTLTSFAATASAADSYRGNNRGNFATQQQYGAGQNMQGPGMRFNDDNMRGPMGQSMRGPNGIAQGGLVRFMCSDNGAPRVEIALNNLSDRLTLSEDQVTLFDAFKTSALTAQTAFADACDTPVAAATQLNPLERLQLRVTHDNANIAAIESVLPSLEAFYNSLTDEQKANLTPARHNDMRVGGQGWFTPGQGPQGQQGNFGPRGIGPGQNNFGPNQGQPGQGFGPGQGQPGQGFGPRNKG